MQGRIYFETDWDFAVKFKGKIYNSHEFDFYINSFEEFESIEFLGPFGGGKEKNLCNCFHVREGMESIRQNPSQHFSNLGGNRGVMWAPNDLNDLEKITFHVKELIRESKIEDKKLVLQKIAQAMGFSIDNVHPYVIIRG